MPFLMDEGLFAYVATRNMILRRIMPRAYYSGRFQPYVG
jgi:hypothetical protein